MLQPIILCGGVGSRLWPLSRVNMPKPFVQLAGDLTLFQQTAKRVAGAGLAAPLVICAESHRFYVLEQLAQIGIKPAAVILEPTPRGTAAAIALAAQWAKAHSITDPLALLPADHLMGPPSEFQEALKSAALAARHHIVLFGITPSFANTEYGYIQHGEAASEGEYKVARFHEKPTRARAEEMLKEGGYSWNSGIFTASASVLETEFQAHSPAIWAQVAKAIEGQTTENLLGTVLIRPGEAFGSTPNEQFDTAVMEKTGKAMVIPYSRRWSDIGNFAALAQALPQDDSGNAATPGTIVSASRASYVHAGTSNKLVAVHGLEGVVVVDTPDALLVTTAARAGEVKSVFNTLQAQNAPQALDHHRVIRPWGWYETIAKGPGFLVKRLGVVPGGRLSLQYHHHRAEHWVVTTGTATVTRDKEVLELKPDESVYLPLGCHHRLENRTDKPVEIVEVQTGAKLEESDIVRLDDVYGRAPQ